MIKISDQIQNLKAIQEDNLEVWSIVCASTGKIFPNQIKQLWQLIEDVDQEIKKLEEELKKSQRVGA